MMCLLDPSKVDDALALVTDLSDKLEDRTLEVRFPKSSRSVPLLYLSSKINTAIEKKLE